MELTRRTAWIITDGKAGMNAQCIGVAEALALDYDLKQVRPTGLRRILSPWIQPSPRERIGRPASQFAPPWPDIAIATGRLAIPYLRAIRKSAGQQTFTIILQDPKTGPRTADLIWVPAHDRLQGENVITTMTSPHAFTPARLKSLRQSPPAELAALPRPLIAVLIGGSNTVYKFSGEAIARFAKAIRSMAEMEVSFMITASRRTPQKLINAIDQATRSRPRILWNEEGDNPYPHFLAQADILVVTADSVNMTSEACATGRPVYVFEPDGGSAKFDRFHEALRRYGATRRLPDTLSDIEYWDYSPLDSASEIAKAVEQHRKER
ncbi:hypothetical protein MnTg02_02583 [bacterium MnTg02]|nr:hypothetical protein MnTg02_02583 [bacterium MnTg02]